MSTVSIADLEARIAALEARLVPQADRPSDVLPGAIYKVGEAAALIRCSPENIYGLVESGALAVTRTGAGKKGFRVRGSDLIAFLESRRAGGPKPRMKLKHLDLD